MGREVLRGNIISPDYSLMRVKNIRLLLFIAFGLLSPVLLADDLHERCDTVFWRGPEHILRDDSSSVRVLGVKGATFPAERHYLPLLRVEAGDFIIKSIEVLHLGMDSLSAEEELILRGVKSVPESFRPYHLYTDGRASAFIDILPLAYDSAAGAYRKIRTYCLRLTTENRVPQGTMFRRHGEPRKSVLRDGTWVRLSVTRDGVYGVDYNMLRRMGLNPDAIDPRTLRLYGNGGKMLPQSNTAERPVDLIENAIWVEGESDGRFDPADRILFYGQNPDERGYDAEGNFRYTNNIYSDTAHYFLTFGGAQGLRMPDRAQAGSGYPAVEYYDYEEVYERDIHNLLASGREWYGERFDGTMSRDFNYLLPGVRSSGIFRVRGAVMASSYAPVSFEWSINGSAAGSQAVEAVPQGTYSQRGWDAEDVFELPAAQVFNAQGQYRVSLRYNAASGVRSIGYLNYFVLEMERELRMQPGGALFFRSRAARQHSHAEFVIADAAEVIDVWDVSEPLMPVRQAFSRSGAVIRFSAQSDNVPQFVAFRSADVQEPRFGGAVANQNIAAEDVPDLLIVAHPTFIQEAERLAAFRRSSEGMRVLVVSTQQVFNEFASGSPDPTAIRDFCKYLYDRSGGGLKNLLLFGRGSFDYKDRQVFKYNFVPIYTSRNSLHPIRSYSSDDYYSFMDEEEGEWPETFDGDHTMDFGVGRIPVKTADEARIVVDKLIRYVTDSATFGAWRNELFFIADDGDFNIHQNDAERLTWMVDTLSPAFNVNKIYLDAYPHIETSTGPAVPEANEAIDRAFDDGCLIMNFTGHGSETRWTAETVLNLSSISRLRNRTRMPLLVTATCEFGRHDNPNIISGAEVALLQAEGGAIGLVTTSRPVFSSTNYILNRAFYQQVFDKPDGGYQSMGQIFRKTKNNSLNGTVNRNFSLLGDPSMTLSYPAGTLGILEAEDTVVPGDTLKALNRVRMRGAVFSNDGVDGNFNGVLNAVVFAPPRQIETFGDESPAMSFDVRDEALFSGQASIVDGEFEFEFIASKNLEFGFGKAKVSLYALDESGTHDANGSEGEYYAGGPGDGQIADSEPPLIALYINDSSFRYGGISGPDPLLLARLSDKSGIDLTGADSGRGILAEVDGNSPINVSKYYISDVDTYQKGWLRYPMSGLEPGLHHLLLRAWDVHGNESSAAIEFLILENRQLVIREMTNMPNPFRDYTEFWLEHNRAGDDLDMLVRIFSIHGEELIQWQERLTDSPGRIGGLVWEGQTSSGIRLNSGVYLLNITLRSLRDGAKSQATRKIVIIN